MIGNQRIVSFIVLIKDNIAVQPLISKAGLNSKNSGKSLKSPKLIAIFNRGNSGSRASLNILISLIAVQTLMILAH